MTEKRANLGLATTRELLNELVARLEVPGDESTAVVLINNARSRLTEKELDYRTVNG